MPEEIPHRMENEGLQKQPVVSTLQSGFVLVELWQGGIFPMTFKSKATGNRRMA
jgi:hypothetical protein